MMLYAFQILPFVLQEVIKSLYESPSFIASDNYYVDMLVS